MIILRSNCSFSKVLLLSIIILLSAQYSFTQPALPQRTITVTPIQAIHFGTFCLTGGAGGTVTVGYDGSRTSTGNILLLSISPTAQPAIFEIKLCQAGMCSSLSLLPRF